MIVHRAATKGRRAGLSQLSQEMSETSSGCILATLLAQRQLPNPHPLLFRANLYNLDVVAKLGWNGCHVLSDYNYPYFNKKC